MAITHWPESERPREKLLQRGPDALSDAELLAIFLRTGVPGKTAVDLARELLVRFGGLRQLLSATQASFCEAPGLGQAKYAQLQAVLELGRRQLQQELVERPGFSDPAAVRRFLQAQLRDLNRECFYGLFLDSQHRLLACEALALGTIDAAAVYPREVVRAALGHGAAALIFAHNHPSGIAEPSQADRLLTERLVQALRTVDIRVLDHFVIGNGHPVSFAERGWL